MWVEATYHARLFTPIVNTGIVFFFAWSPFNAYEAHTPQQFVNNICGAVGVLLLLKANVLTHDLATLRFRESGIEVLGWRFMSLAVILAPVVSYVVSAVVWLVWGAPSIGISVVAEYLAVMSIVPMLGVCGACLNKRMIGEVLSYVAVSVVFTISSLVVLGVGILIVLSAPHIIGLILSLVIMLLLPETRKAINNLMKRSRHYVGG